MRNDIVRELMRDESRQFPKGMKKGGSPKGTAFFEIEVT